MITVENLLMAFASAYDAWLDPEAERENPVPEYAALIRRAVDADNTKLRELVQDMDCWAYVHYNCDLENQFADRMRELGIGVD